MRKVVLPRTVADVDAMSVEEIDAAIAELRQRQRKMSPVAIRAGVPFARGWGNAFSADFDFFPVSGDLGAVEAGWRADAANLHGDVERVGRDMWIGVLQQAKSEKSAMGR